jgi:hypothetical protein
MDFSSFSRTVFFLLSRKGKVGQSDGIEVVVRQRNKTKAKPA